MGNYNVNNIVKCNIVFPNQTYYISSRYVSLSHPNFHITDVTLQLSVSHINNSFFSLFV